MTNTMRHYYINNNGNELFVENNAELDAAYQAFLDSGETIEDDCGYHDEYLGLFAKIVDYDVAVFTGTHTVSYTPWKVLKLSNQDGLGGYTLERRAIDVETGNPMFPPQAMSLPTRHRNNEKYAINAAAKLNAVVEETA